MSTLTEALTYAERGWLVVPLHNPRQGVCSCRKKDCSSPGKHPRTAHGLKDGSKDPQRIERWWQQWPDANVGILTGQDSGLLVLDVDGDSGKASLQALRTARGTLPKTLCAMTGRTGGDGKRKGCHYYFHAPLGVPIRNSAGILGKGLDVRADGGYVVAPPSLHPSELLYKWLAPEQPLADAPDWMLAKLAEAKPAPEALRTQSEAIAEGGRNAALTSLAGRMRRSGITLAAIEAALLEENRQRCSPSLPEEEVRGIAASVSRYSPGEKSKKNAIERRPELIRLSDVTAKPIAWLWEPYLPLEMITLLSGDPGVGKTFISLAIAAALTRGKSLVNDHSAIPANVLYLTLENSPAHVMRPRFDSQNGDAERFYVMQGTRCKDGDTETQGGISLADTEQLSAAISETEARLVVIDPLQSFLGASVDLHRSNETRPVMDGLIRLAEKHQCAILIVRHLSKGQGGRALYRGLGSIDITGAARSELFVAADPNDPTRRIMAHAKSNLGKLGESLAYSIGVEGQLTWGGTSDLTANDLLAPEPTSAEKSAVEEAMDFLREVLTDGPKASTDVQEQARASGISSATLRRARERLGVLKQPGGFGRRWMLALPSVAQQSPELLNLNI